jgi:UDP-N-acetylmuramyl tripeptide synthase
MQIFLATLIGKKIQLLLKFRRGGGQALPGLIIERLFPNYVADMLGKLPEGAVIITGTNGKTTTTKIVTHILEANHKRVITNSTGSNLIRGIASSIARHASITGKLKYDIAVLEVDEATARLLVKKLNPRWVLGLNVSRDQLDRYGEIDTVAAHVQAAMAKATRGIVTNADDPHLMAVAKKAAKDSKAEVIFFGAAAKLKRFFPSDYELAAVSEIGPSHERPKKIDVELSDFDGREVAYKIGSQSFTTKLKISGQHNYLNGAAALALCRHLLPEVPVENLVERLANVSLAFGRGEKYRLKNGAVVELVLVKNPASFTQALASYADKQANLMIAINDNIADGRDVSWLWDVNFAPLSKRRVFVTSGKRAADMALRLSYDGVATGKIDPSLTRALKELSRQDGSKIILSTYTAMLELYGILNKSGKKVI